MVRLYLSFSFLNGFLFLDQFFPALPADTLRYSLHLQTSHCLYGWSAITATKYSLKQSSLTLHCHRSQSETAVCAGWYPVRPSETPWLHPTVNYRSQGKGLDFVWGYHTHGFALLAYQIIPSALSKEFGGFAFLFQLHLIYISVLPLLV